MERAAPDEAGGPSPAAAAALVAACVAIGAALRLYGLEVQSLWNDELSSWVKATRYASWVQLVRHGLPIDHPPGYFTLLYAWVRVAGDSAAAMRLPSALAGIALIPAMYALGRRCYGRREGVIAAALVAVAWAPVYFSQEARAYALLLLAVVGAALCLLEVVRALRAGRRPRLAAAIGYVGCAAAAMYLHYFGLLFVALQAVGGALAVPWRGRALAWLALLYAGVLLVYLPWLPRAAVVVGGGPNWIEPPALGALWRFVRFLFNRSDALAALAVALWVALATPALRRWRRGDIAAGDRVTWALFAWLLLPPAIAWVRSHVATPVFLDRTLLIVAPAAYLLVARALTQLASPRAVAPLAAALASVLLFDLLVGKRYYVLPTKEQFREAAAYVVARDDRTEAAALLSSANPRYFDYYLARLGSPRRIDRMVAAPADRAAVAALAGTEGPPQVWVLAAHREPDPVALHLLAAQRPLLAHRRWRGAAVWRFGPLSSPRGGPARSSSAAD